MEILTTVITFGIGIAGQGLDFLISEPILLVPVGLSLLGSAVYFVKGLV